MIIGRIGWGTKMRTRLIKPDFFIDEDIASLEPLLRIFYVGLWCAADREGRLRDRSGNLKAQILPYDNINAEGFLNQLSKPKQFGDGDPFIVRYEVDGQRYIHILKFVEHARPHYSERPSAIPPPPEQ